MSRVEPGTSETPNANNWILPRAPDLTFHTTENESTADDVDADRSSKRNKELTERLSHGGQSRN
jgi:hypothetical protein